MIHLRPSSASCYFTQCCATPELGMEHLLSSYRMAAEVRPKFQDLSFVHHDDAASVYCRVRCRLESVRNKNGQHQYHTLRRLFRVNSFPRCPVEPSLISILQTVECLPPRKTDLDMQRLGNQQRMCPICSEAGHRACTVCKLNSYCNRMPANRLAGPQTSVQGSI